MVTAMVGKDITYSRLAGRSSHAANDEKWLNFILRFPE
jgi:hypothetical protein